MDVRLMVMYPECRWRRRVRCSSVVLALAFAGLAGPAAYAAPRPAAKERVAPADPCGPHVPAIQIDQSTAPPKPGRPTGQNRCFRLPPQPRTPFALRRSGRWEQGSVDLPHYAIHAALLPTGKVLFWGFEWTRAIVTKVGSEIGGRAALWDPAKGTGPRSIKIVRPPMLDVNGDGVPERAPIYCAGQTLLPDGRVLVVGGALETVYSSDGYRYPPGHRFSFIFDPATETWKRGPDASVGRWYPTLAPLPDGRTLILGGFDDARPGGLSHNLDVASADGRTIQHVASADRETMLYPAMTVMPDGQVLLAGPFARDSALLDPRSMRWTDLPPLPTYRGGANLVPVPSGTGRSPRAMLIGGTTVDGYFDGRTKGRAFRSTLVYDQDAHPHRWRAAPSQRRRRYYPNTVLLPDGSMITLGGSSGVTPTEGNYTPSHGNRHVELWNPATGHWRLGAAQREDRTYHSVALLLPDGRVWSAGDDANTNRDGDTGEIYDPPYLFKGPRPRITHAPARIVDRQRFTLRATGAVRRVVLVAPGATTHAVDMHQRFVELHVRHARAGRLVVDGPRGAAVAPRGRWMLFALSTRGVPSIARWVDVHTP